MSKKKQMISSEELDRLTNKMVDDKRIYSAVICVENRDKSISLTSAAGAMQKDTKFFIASVTKLYVTAVIMRLIEEERLRLNDPISNYLSETICKELHIFKGVDYSNDIIIKHLISNTSGLPDYFFHKQPNGSTVADELMEGQDEPWPLERTIPLVKKINS